MASDASGMENRAVTRRGEVDRKVERLARLAHDSGLSGIVLSTQHNFAWLTAGRSNRVDASRETGTVSLLVTADARRFALANNIEAPRAAAEAVADLGFELIEYRWIAERGTPLLAFERAARAAGTGPLGADTVSAAVRPMEGPLSVLRCVMDADEMPRYRALAAAAGRIVGEVARMATPGMRELDVAHVAASALGGQDINAPVLLVGGDERIARYRHPVATGHTWRERLLIVVCAERDGMVVALSRMIAGRRDTELERRTHATAAVYGALLSATVSGTSGAEIFAAAARAYAAAGFAGEEEKHHQGGAIAYRSREWVGHPGSTDVVTPPQAFAYNPSITGTKVEETAIVHEDGRVEIVTTTPGWPAIDVAVRDQRLAVPDVLIFGA